MNIALIVAAGKSQRYSKYKDKLLEPVLGLPLVYYTIQAFNDHPLVSQIYIAANQKNKNKIIKFSKKFHLRKVKKVVLGGETRFISVKKGLQAIQRKHNDDIIIIHNGANPLVTEKEITDCIKAASLYGAAAAGGEIKDTVKEIKKGHIIRTHDRSRLAGMQTPQAAKYGLFKKGFEKIIMGNKPGAKFTDDSSIIENLGYKVKLTPASELNFKVTTVHDLARVKHIMGDTPKDYLVGLGQDSHRFVQVTNKVKAKKSKSIVRGLWLGGAFFKNRLEVESNSDGDVILHALYNAVSQALGGSSLGVYATPLCTVKKIKSSKEYLRPLLMKLKRKKYRINNIGIMLECSRPKIDPMTREIKKSLNKLTGLEQEKIGITATSGEKLTSFGRGEGIQCFAIVSLKKES